MKFGEVLKIHRTELVISPRYDAWIRENSNPVFSTEALEHGVREMRHQATPRIRRGGVSASSMGKCIRRQQFTYIGLPEIPFSSKTAAILVNGTFMHIRWQMVGLTEGFLSSVEVPVPLNDMALRGTMDAIAWDDSVVEFKSCNSNSFNRVLTFGPLHGHEDQLYTYMAASGREKGVFIYENKDTQDYKEIVVHRDEKRVKELADRALMIHELIGHRKLAEPLDAAYEMKAPCSTCPFRKSCLGIKTWEQAEEVAA